MTTERPSPAAWLLSAFGSDRQYAGNIGYDDAPKRIYKYDSFVANHKAMSSGDLVVLRDKEAPLGIAKIQSVVSYPATKILRRCPVCQTTGIKQRKTKTPLYRCNRKHEFDTPKLEERNCDNFEALFGGSFFPLDVSVTLEQLRAVCPRYTDQLSMQAMDLERLHSLLPANSATRLDVLRTRHAFAGGLPERDSIERASAKEAASKLEERPRKGGGQGFRSSSALRACIERHAMQAAKSFFESHGFELQDTSSNRPYDYLGRRGSERLYIEVKGTTTNAERVILTRNEVQHAHKHTGTVALFVLKNIQLSQREPATASGGEPLVYWPWDIDTGLAIPLSFSYELPPKNSP